MKQNALYNPRMRNQSEGYEVSANPADYFQDHEQRAYNGFDLIADERNSKGWVRTKLLKRNPRKIDLIKLNKKLKIFI